MYPQIAYSAATQIPTPADSQINAADALSPDTYLAQLDFVDLIKMAKVSDRFERAVAHLLRTRYRIHEKTVRIEQVEQETHLNDAIILTDFPAILELLQHFGHAIRRIYFSGMFFSTEQRARINRHIADYCAQTLVELELCDADGYLISDTNRTFPHVTRLNVQNFEYADNLDLSRIYPNVKWLTFCAYDNEITSLVRPFAHLEHLTTVRIAESTVLALVRLHPKLRSFHMHDVASLAFLRNVSQLLPALASLELKHGPDGFLTDASVHVEDVRFESVTHFGIAADGFDEITFERLPLTFGRLNSLKITSPTPSTVYRRLVDENRQLAVLTLDRVSDAEAVPLIVDLAGQLERLVELSVSWMDEVDESDVLALVDNLRHLKKVILDFWIEFDCADLVPKIGAQWNVANETFSLDACMLTLVS